MIGSSGKASEEISFVVRAECQESVSGRIGRRRAVRGNSSYIGTMQGHNWYIGGTGKEDRVIGVS